MRREIFWSPLAEKDLENILEYLSENWNQLVVIRFLHKIDLVIDQISKVPTQYPIINKKLQLRKCVVTKQNTLFCRAVEGRIEILRLYDTRQDPGRLQLIWVARIFLFFISQLQLTSSTSYLLLKMLRIAPLAVAHLMAGNVYAGFKAVLTVLSGIVGAGFIFV